MRVIEALELEQIGDDLCLVFKTNEGRGRGILGKISPGLLDSLARQFRREAGRPERSSAGMEPRSLYEI